MNNLLVGGYAVCYHGHYRNTNDIDFWIKVDPGNAARITAVLYEFGFNRPEISEKLFLEKGKLIRMGMEPTRIEIQTEISACEFSECYARRIEGELNGVPVHISAFPTS